MKVLQFCNKPPCHPVDGGCIAMNQISQGLLEQGVDLKIFSIETDKHPVSHEQISPEYIAKTRFESVYVNTRVNLVDAFSALVTSDSYNVSRFFTPDVDIRLKEILQAEEFDIIHLESLFVSPYIGTIRRYNPKAKVVLRSHNLEYMIWARLTSQETNRLKKSYLKVLASQIRRYEENTIREVDGIAAISFKDAEKYQGEVKIPVTTIPFGVNSEKILDKAACNSTAVFHLGAMDWMPNLEAIEWFIDKVYPLLPDEIKIHFAGRGMPDKLIKKSKANLKIEGEIQSADAYLSDKAIMVVPILSAGGIRIKIIEGMAKGKAIISTSIGAEGIHYTDGEDILIADTPKVMAEKIISLCQNPNEIERLGNNAISTIKNEYDNSQLSKRLIAFYEKLL
jgi:glycosyltransferase involved in cell wall biosynthesis